MKAVIVGAGGQLGRALTRRSPHSCFCHPLTREELDITDRASVETMFRRTKPDIILNAAAYTAVDLAESDKATAFMINAEAVRTLVQVADEISAHFVHISTDFVFDGSSPYPYRTDAKRNPLSVYGLSKAAGDEAAGPDSTIVRTSWVYASEGDNFVLKMLRLMREAPIYALSLIR